MQEKELEAAGGSLRYRIEKERAVITGYHGMAGELTVPDSIEECPVEAIGKKAFLSNKHLRKVILPDGIKTIGEWAFAYCSGLEEVLLGGRRDLSDGMVAADDVSIEEYPQSNGDAYLTFGRAVFLDCPNLKKITLPYQTEDIAYLLAAAVSKMDAYYLLDVAEAGNAEWLGKWDARMLTLLHTPDQDGYSKQVLCGEEDYGSTDFQAYLNGKRKSKVRLLFIRLLHPVGLSAELQQELEDYLTAHTAGCESREAWEIICTEHGDDREYYELFAEIGGVKEENLEEMLADIGEDFPEMKAYFMRFKAEQIGYGDFFGELSLDL